MHNTTIDINKQRFIGSLPEVGVEAKAVTIAAGWAGVGRVVWVTKPARMGRTGVVYQKLRRFVNQVR
jgi:hypothetical protein